jgi:hypothetical protein
LNKLIGTTLSIFLAAILITAVITLTFFSFIITVQAKMTEEISTAKKIEESFFSKPTKDNDILNQSTIIIKQQKNDLNKNLSKYEGLGIQLKYSYPWTIQTKSDKSTCYNIDLCFVYLEILNRTDMPQAWVIQDNTKSQTIKEYCKCNTLEDYERHFYTNMISQSDKFSFINENKTTLLSLGDRPAIQLEYEFVAVNTTIHTLNIITSNNDGDSFYQFIYYADAEDFSKYLSDFKKIIDTIEFTTQKES